MSKAARTLFLTPRRRVVPHLVPVLQAAAAAVAAWYLALALLPIDRPAFASIAAVICLGVTHGQRRRRAAELIGGVVVGIGVASVLLYVIGTGHRRATPRDGFTVVGAYPAGQEDYDLLRGDDPAEVEAARERIAKLPAPPRDPVGGEGVAHWH